MKKAVIFLCVFIALPFLCAAKQAITSYNANSVHYKIFVNGTEKQFINPVVNINGNTYIPLREAAETLGMDVQWDSDNQTIQINSKSLAVQASSENRKNGEDWFMFIQNGKTGYMDKNGNIEIPAQFEDAFNFVNGFARVSKTRDDAASILADSGVSLDQWAFIDTSGKMITPYKFSYAWDFNEGLAAVQENNKDIYYIDRQGNKSSQKYLGTDYFTHGFMPIHLRGGNLGHQIPNSIPEVWSYINSKGDRATDHEFEEAQSFTDGLAISKKNDKYGLIDINFNTAIDYKYDGLKRVGTGLYAAKKDNLWGLINNSDNIIADFSYSNIGIFSEGLAPVSIKNSDGAYIDSKGNVSLDNFGFKVTFNFFDGYACVRDKNSGKYGVIDRAGKYVVKPAYYYMNQEKSGLIDVQDQRGTEHYYINPRGDKIIPH